jgi:septal ring factor EnvC (AmiA/AmiB activator)
MIVAVLLSALSQSLLLAQDGMTQWQELKTELEQTRAALANLLKGQANIVDQLDQLETSLELSSKLQRAYRWQIANVEAEIAATRLELLAARSELSQSDRRQEQQLRHYYMNRGATSTTADDYLIATLLASGQEYQDSLLAQTEESRELLVILAQQQENLQILRDAQNQEQTTTQAAMRQREELLVQLQTEHRKRARELADLTESSEVFGAIAEELDWEKDTLWQHQAEALAERSRGKLQWPIAGEIVESFGISREAYTGLTGRSSGIKIATQPGRKVVAALSGEVVYSGWARGLEQFVILAHTGRLYTLYGNLDSLQVSEGDRVLRGESFAQSAAERLHFEVREGKTAVDPLAWLKP